MVCVLLVVTLTGASEGLRSNRKTEEQILQEETSLWGRLLQDSSMRTAPTARAATKGEKGHKGEKGSKGEKGAKKEKKEKKDKYDGSEDGGGDAYGVPKKGKKMKKRQRLLNVN